MTKIDEYKAASSELQNALKIIERYKDTIGKVNQGLADVPSKKPKVNFVNFREANRRLCPAEIILPPVTQIDQSHWPKVEKFQEALEDYYIARDKLKNLWKEMNEQEKAGFIAPPN